ncbi:MAG TPA: hypothetical protein VEV41_18300 [Terriglobales bacterium]|nr:hypothetical protein [Terriglobales bacterium]
MNTLLSMFRLALLVTLGITLFATVPRTSAAADSLPTGEVQLGQSILEPAYNDLDGTLTYLLTPIKAPEQANSHAVAPLYVIVYPTPVAGIIGTVSCQHQPMDNCPDHGPAIAGLAEAAVPAVYSGGVWGHDHILSAPPSPPPSGGDFNVAWLPVAVLFTSPAAASNHITTLSQLNAAIAAGEVTQIPLPAATFHCSTVAATVYNKGTPVPPAPPLP